MRKNEHPACHCSQCRRGAGGPFGQLIHRLTNRRIRHRYKQAFRKAGADEVDQIIVGTPYTD